MNEGAEEERKEEAKAPRPTQPSAAEQRLLCWALHGQAPRLGRLLLGGPPDSPGDNTANNTTNNTIDVAGVRDSLGRGALHLAAACALPPEAGRARGPYTWPDHWSTVKLLLERASASAVNAADRFGRTPLLVLCREAAGCGGLEADGDGGGKRGGGGDAKKRYTGGHEVGAMGEVAGLLLASKADPALRDRRGRCCFDYLLEHAAGERAGVCARLLRRLFASPGTGYPGLDAEASLAVREIVLSSPRVSGPGQEAALEIARALAGCPGAGPLRDEMLLQVTGGLHASRALVARGLDVEVRDAHGQTPAVLAARYGSLEVLRLLVEAKASPEPNTGCKGAMWWAVKKEMNHVVAYLHWLVAKEALKRDAPVLAMLFKSIADAMGKSFCPEDYDHIDKLITQSERVRRNWSTLGYAPLRDRDY